LISSAQFLWIMRPSIPVLLPCPKSKTPEVQKMTDSGRGYARPER
jgi:hypothetical protein